MCHRPASTYRLTSLPGLRAEQVTVPPLTQLVAAAEPPRLRYRRQRNSTQLNATQRNPTSTRHYKTTRGLLGKVHTHPPTQQNLANPTQPNPTPSYKITTGLSTRVSVRWKMHWQYFQ